MFIVQRTEDAFSLQWQRPLNNCLYSFAFSRVVCFYEGRVFVKNWKDPLLTLNGGFPRCRRRL